MRRAGGRGARMTAPGRTTYWDYIRVEDLLGFRRHLRALRRKVLRRRT